MTSNLQSTRRTSYSSASSRRTILCVDPDGLHGNNLYDTWQQLRLADELHIAHSPEEAIRFLDSAGNGSGPGFPVAIVLDPDATGEETGPLVRELKHRCAAESVPVVFWTRNGEMYRVLEGRTVDSVLEKPMILRLIHALDEACGLTIQRFDSGPGSSTK